MSQKAQQRNTTYTHRACFYGLPGPGNIFRASSAKFSKFFFIPCNVYLQNTLS